MIGEFEEACTIFKKKMFYIITLYQQFHIAYTQGQFM
jgi:hypothetical protein